MARGHVGDSATAEVLPFLLAEMRLNQERRGWCVTDLAFELGVPRESWSRVLSGRQSLTLSDFLLWCQAMTCHPGHLILNAYDALGEDKARRERERAEGAGGGGSAPGKRKRKSAKREG